MSDVIDQIKALEITLPEDNDAWYSALVQGLDQTQMNSLGTGGVGRVIAHMMANAFLKTTESIKDYNQNVAVTLVSFFSTGLAEGSDDVKKLEALLRTDNSLLMNLDQQIRQLPLTQGGGSSRQPKIGEPPEFNGTDGKVKFPEWLSKIELWIVHEGVATDRQRIAVAMNKLSGAAAQYMEPWIKKLTSGGSIGTWDEFILELKVQYGRRDEKEGSKKELNTLFGNTDLAHKNFVKFAEKFRTLGRISGYEDQFLIEKLDHVIEKDMRLVLIGYRRNGQAPTGWYEYLDMLLEVYKEVHPEKAQGHVFGGGKEKDTSSPMDIDNADKNKNKKFKGKGKGKEANATDTNKKYCHICDMSNHNTKDCRFNTRAAGKQDSKPSGDKKDKEGKKEDKSASKKKYVRAADVEKSSESSSSDSEAESPKASSSKKHAQIRSAYIHEISDEDEPSTPRPTSEKGKGKMKQIKGRDFFRGDM